MTAPSNSPGEVYAQAGAAENYGLRAGALGPVETLAQSVSAMAPSTRMPRNQLPTETASASSTEVLPVALSPTSRLKRGLKLNVRCSKPLKFLIVSSSIRIQ